MEVKLSSVTTSDTEKVQRVSATSHTITVPQSLKENGLADLVLCDSTLSCPPKSPWLQVYFMT